MNLDSTALAYQSGFGNEFSSEALPGALPVGQNSPQKAPYGLYAELLSGTAFTMARSEARRTWLYRITPSAKHPPFRRLERQIAGAELDAPTPNRLRWDPLALPEQPTDFLDGLLRMAANAPGDKPAGVSIYQYLANRSMERCFYDADGELLLVPQLGRLRLCTELGALQVEPLEIAVIPRGMKFRPWPGRRPAKACRLRQRPAAWRHPSAALRRRPCRRPVACPANPSRDRQRARRASSRSPWHTCRRSWKSCRYWAQAFSAGSSAQRPWALHQASAATTHQGRRPWEFSICEGIASWLAQGMEQGPGQLRRERPRNARQGAAAGTLALPAGPVWTTIQSRIPPEVVP